MNIGEISALKPAVSSSEKKKKKKKKGDKKLDTLQQAFTCGHLVIISWTFIDSNFNRVR